MDPIGFSGAGNVDPHATQWAGGRGWGPVRRMGARAHFPASQLSVRFDDHHQQLIGHSWSIWQPYLGPLLQQCVYLAWGGWGAPPHAVATRILLQRSFQRQLHANPEP
jgi:hypothetical protein